MRRFLAGQFLSPRLVLVLLSCMARRSRNQTAILALITATLVKLSAMPSAHAEVARDQGCPVGIDDRSSDLCAQWKAADAAAESARWSWIAGLASIASFIAVLFALRLAQQANAIARDTAKRQLRAYIFVEKTELIVSDVARQASFAIEWRNSGQTPAYRVLSGCDIIIADTGWKGNREVEFPPSGYSKDNIGPGGVQQILDYVITLSPDEFIAWKAGSRTLYIFSEVHYDDVFGEGHMTKRRMKAVWNDIKTKIELTTEDFGSEAS